MRLRVTMRKAKPIRENSKKKINHNKLTIDMTTINYHN